MPDQDSPKPTESQLKDQEADPNSDPDEEKANLSSSDDSESEYDSDLSSEYEGDGVGGGEDGAEGKRKSLLHSDFVSFMMKRMFILYIPARLYEGTVWDDLAHGKGVYVAEQGLVRYEGEWLQNNMEGHGVVELDIPDIEPIPGLKRKCVLKGT